MAYQFVICLAVVHVFYYSLAEWLLHCFVMHKNLAWFKYPFATHTLVHHHRFKADHTYHGDNHPEDMSKITMAKWNGAVLVSLASLPWFFVSLVSGHWIFLVMSVIVGAAYYGTYEYIHYCMHLPRERRIEMNGLFRWLNAHHLLHHKYMKRNFNVVLPFWDWVFGTLKTIADTPFVQPKGPYIRNVQPFK